MKQGLPSHTLGYTDPCTSAISRYLCTREYYPGNGYYGIGKILRGYAGLPPYYPLNCKIDHGVKFVTGYRSMSDCPSGFFSFYTSKDPACTYFTFNAMIKSFLNSIGIMNVHVIGAPVIYLDDYLNTLREQHPKRKGTVAFPCKSTFGNDYAMNHGKYADMLLELPEKYHPVRVCIYYKDKLKGRDKAYLDRGLEVVCNGGLQAQDFLYNLFANIADCEYAVANDVLGSSVYYSMYFGLKFFYYGPEIEGVSSRSESDAQYGREKLKGRKFCPYDFSRESCEDTERQKGIADEVLGREFKLEPEELRHLFKAGHSFSFIARYGASLVSKRFQRKY